MKPNPLQANDGSFLFQVEILVSAPTNGIALEKLLHALNQGGFEDYRIGSGIQLGKRIEDALAQDKKKAPPPKTAQTASPAAVKPAAPSAAAKTAAPAPQPDDLEKRIHEYIRTNKLIRLNVNKGRGVKLSIPCRIVGFDASLHLLTVYHVDEKQVHSIKLFEIDDFIE